MRRADRASDRLRRRVASFVREHDILRAGERAVLLLSGGADSMALLDLLPEVDEQLGLGLQLAALHVDYASRGAESERDRAIVAEACAAAGIPLHELRLSRKLQGGGFQARARALRYDEARALAEREGYDVAVTAHNRDDQAETVLYRLAKYATPRGLAGMRPRDGFVARPLLCLDAAEIRAYCGARDITYGEDVTNALPVYARNRIRLEVVPALTRINPRVTETIAAGAELAAAQDEALAELAAAAAERVLIRPEGDDLRVVDVERLWRESPAVRDLVLHSLVRELLAGDALVQRRAVAALSRLVAAPHEGGRVTLRGGLEAVREGGFLRLAPRAAPHVCQPATAELSGAHDDVSLDWCGRRFRLRLEPDPCSPAAQPGEAFIAAPHGARGLTLRHPRRGERFAPLGLGHETTVGRFLAAARVPPAARPLALVLDVDGAVAWVAFRTVDGAWRGRVAESFRVQESSGLVAHVFEEGT